MCVGLISSADSRVAQQTMTRGSQAVTGLLKRPQPALINLGTAKFILPESVGIDCKGGKDAKKAGLAGVAFRG